MLLGLHWCIVLACVLPLTWCWLRRGVFGWRLWHLIGARSPMGTVIFLVTQVTSMRRLVQTHGGGDPSVLDANYPPN